MVIASLPMQIPGVRKLASDEIMGHRDIQAAGKGSLSDARVGFLLSTTCRVYCESSHQLSLHFARLRPWDHRLGVGKGPVQETASRGHNAPRITKDGSFGPW